MWVLDVCSSYADEEKKEIKEECVLYLRAGEWTLGRKGCSYNFIHDRSVSRSHVTIHVTALKASELPDPSTRQVLSLSDNGSTFGTFLNDKSLSKGHEHVLLQEGDVIRLGGYETVFQVRYLPLVGVISRVQKANRASMSEIASSIGMHLLREPCKDATHCIMDPGPVIATAKVLWALVNNQSIISTQWIVQVMAQPINSPLPPCEQFLPSDSNEGDSVMENYLPDARRSTLYKSFLVVFVEKSNMEGLIQSMGGIEFCGYKCSDVDGLKKLVKKHQSNGGKVLVVTPSAVDGSSQPFMKTLLSMGAWAININDLAGSIIYVRSPLIRFDSPSEVGDTAAASQTISLQSHAPKALEPLQKTPIQHFRSCAEIDGRSLTNTPFEKEQADVPGEEQSNDPEPVSVQSTQVTWMEKPPKENRNQNKSLQSSTAKEKVPISLEPESLPIATKNLVPQKSVGLCRKNLKPTEWLGRSDRDRQLTFTDKDEDNHEKEKEQVPNHLTKSYQETNVLEMATKTNEKENPWQPIHVVQEPVPVEVGSLILLRRSPLLFSSGFNNHITEVNFKNFRKGNVFDGSKGDSSILKKQKTFMHAQVTRMTVELPTVNDFQLEMERNQRELENQERVAEKLFALRDKPSLQRSTRKC